MDSNFRCPITPPQLEWWRLHINVSTVPIPDKYVLTAWRLHWGARIKPRISLVMFQNFGTDGFKNIVNSCIFYDYFSMFLFDRTICKYEHELCFNTPYSTQTHTHTARQ